MKKICLFFHLCFLIFMVSFPKHCFTQNVGIGTTTPNASAMLDVQSTSKGLLPPRMTTLQRDAISSPAPGLIIFNTDTQSIEVSTNTGWFAIKKTNLIIKNLFGGIGNEAPAIIQKTTDGGYIVAGNSVGSSANGDVTGSTHGGKDYWIVKFNATGTIIWNKLLGGTGDESASSIQQTTDGGYIVAGSSTSSANGDVTGVNHGTSFQDYWIVKLDANGNILWNKLLGGTGSEDASSIQQTTDGGYIVAGTSFSSANGDVTATNHGLPWPDIWIVKLDANGNILWNKLLGGNYDEYALSIQQTTDGGYIVAGTSSSSANGDVTGTSHGGNVWTDYWIVKLNASGNIIWNRLLGGNYNEVAHSIQQTTDGGYIVAGSSGSSANGDVTGANHGLPLDDYWIVKLDASGNILWNKLMGGNDDDIASSIQQTIDGGYIVAGYSGSSANGDVTGVNHGGAGDFWIVKLDANGNIIWNKLLGGNGEDKAYSIRQIANGGYIVAGQTTSSSNGDITVTNHGGYDYWIVKLNASGYIIY
jgi:hypothetical protein